MVFFFSNWILRIDVFETKNDNLDGLEKREGDIPKTRKIKKVD
jgi:hypothetical protein